MSKEEEKRVDKCKFSHYDWKNSAEGVEKRLCSLGEKENKGWEATDEERCESCANFKSRYIEFPITVNGIETEPINYSGLFTEVGSLVAVRPCGEEYNKKTYLGFFLGDLPLNNSINYNEKSGVLRVGTLNNPAMFVPELKKIIWGCGSWWHEIKSAEELREITDEDINGVWYVKLLKAVDSGKKKED